MDKFPSNPSGLTDNQEKTRVAFWTAVMEGKACGGPALSYATGLTRPSVESSLQRLRSMKLIPLRNSHVNTVPSGWSSCIPDEFITINPTPFPEIATSEPAITSKRYFPEHIDPADVGHPYGDLQARVLELEAELVELRRANEWLTHSDSQEYRGGTMTVNLSDLHYFDRGHLVACHLSLEDKVVALIDRFQPRKLQVLLNGDVVPGKGIYRNQSLESVLPDAEQQVAAGAWRWRECREKMIQHLPKGAEESHIIVKGTHDSSDGSDTCLRFVLALRAMGIPASFVGTETIMNLADDGHYNVLVEHGFGNSAYNPGSNRLILESYKKIISYQQRGYAGEKAIRRVLTGHVHWLAVGIQRAENVFYDTTGGLHRNDRADLGKTSRPVGWIVYISPPGAKDILQPIEITPDTIALHADVDDPNLSEKNRSESARCLTAWSKWAIGNGIISDIRITMDDPS